MPLSLGTVYQRVVPSARLEGSLQGPRSDCTFYTSVRRKEKSVSLGTLWITRYHKQPHAEHNHHELEHTLCIHMCLLGIRWTAVMYIAVISSGLMSRPTTLGVFSCRSGSSMCSSRLCRRHGSGGLVLPILPALILPCHPCFSVCKTTLRTLLSTCRSSATRNTS